MIMFRENEMRTVGFEQKKKQQNRMPESSAAAKPMGQTSSHSIERHLSSEIIKKNFEKNERKLKNYGNFSFPFQSYRRPHTNQTTNQPYDPMKKSIFQK